MGLSSTCQVSASSPLARSRFTSTRPGPGPAYSGEGIPNTAVTRWQTEARRYEPFRPTLIDLDRYLKAKSHRGELRIGTLRRF